MSFHNKTANLRGGYVSIEWQEDEIIMSPSIPRDFSRSLVSMHRSLDEVERVGTLDCRLMTSMKTDYGGFAKAKGTMFSLTVKERLDLLSMEFDIAEGISGGDVAMEVYYRKGEFSGYTNDQQQWTKLADTIFYLAPDGKGAIIPTNEFTTVTMEPGQKYSIYLSFQSDVLKLKTSKQLIGELYQSTDILDLYVGVTLDDGPFPNTFGIASDFAGVLHYRTLLPCSRVLMTTSVPMEFAINENPDPDTLNELADAVKKAITALITLNPTLIRYEKFHELELQDVASGFQGRSGT